MNSETSQVETPKPKRFWRKFVPALVVLLVAAVAVFYGPQLYDMFRASQFKPSAQVATAEQRIDLTTRGEQIFYATTPVVEDKDQFNKSCESTERTAAILGCYFRDRIYLFNIQNKELDGTLEVTAAHEMLHAAYARLNMFERPHVDEMVQAEYEKIKDQPAIKQIMQYYSKAEPGAERDELHSIIGTTVKDLPPELESYYARYFADRAAVVALNASYNAVFSDLSARADSLQKQIDTARPEIERDLATYNTDLEQLNLDVQNFNARAQAGEFTAQAEFQTARSALVARVNELDARREDLNARVNALNDNITALNAIAVHVNQLNQSLNGVSAPEAV